MSNLPGTTVALDEALDRLCLFRSENVGPITYRQLLAHFRSAGAALDALPSLAKRGGRRRPLRRFPREDAIRELASLEALGGHLLVLGDPAFPTLLGAVEDCPPVISAIGDIALLQRPSVAIVGTRNSSTNGRLLAERFARALADAGYPVVSGLARGIDTAAHQASLDGGTVAVMAGGIDEIYPKDNAPLYREIATRGILVSEMPIGTVPQARHFPRRNRIISGLSVATLVVEAQLKSGSLITARLAADQGRDVFAVPGSPLDPRSRGSNDLIRKGATLVETPEELVTAIGQMPITTLAEPNDRFLDDRPALDLEAASDTDRLRARVRSAIGPSPVAIDDLIRDIAAPAGTVSAVLLELELAGDLERHPGGMVALLARDYADDG